MKISCTVGLSGVGLWLVASLVGADTTPVPVSPGHAQRFVTVQGSCPTFSWDAVPGARGHELVIYRIDEQRGAEPEPLRTLSLPGSAASWTPSLERCLTHGQAYAWAVRALGLEHGSAWSETRLFRIAPEPSEAEFRQALELVRTYAAARLGETESATAETLPAAPVTAADDLGDPSSSEGPAQPALGDADFSIDGSGHVEAASFTGDGSALTGLDWDHLVDVPAGFADGVDDGATYTGTTPITVAGSSIGLSSAGCAAGEIWKWTGSAWSCVADTDTNTTYSAGTGLDLAGTTFSVDSAIVARKDSAAGNQTFDSNTLFLDYKNNRVGVGMSSLDQELDVKGDIEVSGQYYYNVARTFYQYIGSEEFLPRDTDMLTLTQSPGYKFSLSTSAQWAYAPVDLPQGADVTEVRCYYYDNSTSADIYEIQFSFWSRLLNDPYPNKLGGADSYSTGASTAIASFVDSSISGQGDPISNDDHAYWINLGMDLTAGSIANNSVRFHGCRITYKLEQISF